MEEKGLILGRNPVLEYLHAASPDSDGDVYISITAHGKIIDTILEAARSKRLRIHRKEKSFFAPLGPSSLHQGVAMSLPGSSVTKAGDMSIIGIAAEKKGVLVLLDRLEDPHNVGSIIRTAEALGCDGVVLSRSHSAGITPAVVKSSAGATAHIPIIQAPNVASFLDDAKSSGYWVIGTAGEGSTDIGELRALRPCVVVIGGEHGGMRRLTGEKCDVVVRVPLAGSMSSLNASVAAGIVLYEIMRKV